MNHYRYLIVLIVFFLVSCSEHEFSSSVGLQNSASLSVDTPANRVYTNSTNFNFQWTAEIEDNSFAPLSQSVLRKLSPQDLDTPEEVQEHLELRIYNTPVCSENPEARSWQRVDGRVPDISMEPVRIKTNYNSMIKDHRERFDSLSLEDKTFFNTTMSHTFNVEDLSDGDAISAKLFYTKGKLRKESRCSASVYVDLQAPSPVTFLYPVADNYIGENHFQLRFSPSSDNGVAGLADEPYQITLFDQPNCAGNQVEQHQTDDLEIDFINLVNLQFYSVQITTVDKAGNHSVPVCSAHVEIDQHVPVLTVSDPESIPGYTKTTQPTVNIDNVPANSYYCITEDLGFTALNTTSICPGLNGTFNGWFESEPQNMSISLTQGLKDLVLWIADSDGNLLSNRQGRTQITYDSIGLSDVSIDGIGGNLDLIYDEWLYSTQRPDVKIIPSVTGDAYRYSVSILDSSSNVVCPSVVTNHPTDLSTGFSCLLNDGESYEAVLVSYDRALNSSEVRSSFTVDITPPGDFDVLGVDGGLDVNVDQFIGPTLPRVHYTDAIGESMYVVVIRDSLNNLFCVEQTQSAGVLMNDFGVALPTDCGTLVENENYFVEIYASDLANNRTNAVNNNFSFVADLTAPSVSITSAPASLLIATDAVFSFEVQDPISSVAYIECSLDGAPFTTCTSPISYSGLGNGAHTFDVRGTDRVGNQSASVRHNWFVDLIDPVLSINSRPPLMTNAPTSVVTFSAVDVSGIKEYQCRENAAVWVVCSSPWTGATVEGAYTLEVKAIDNIDRESSVQTVTWQVDRVSPTLTFIQPPANNSSSTSTGSSLVLFTINDDQSVPTSTCSWDGAPAVACSGTTSRSGLVAGPHTLTIVVTDAAGNDLVVTNSFIMTTHSWQVSAFGACSASPTWTGYGACSASPYWGGYGGCSRSCGGGVQYRSCYGTSGTMSRSCVNTSGVRTRSVTCMRNNGSTQSAVADGQCSDAKPALTQACSAGCSGSATASCSRSCSGSSSRSCNTQACVATTASCSGWVHAAPFPRSPSFGGGLTEAQCRNVCVSYAINTMRVTPGTVFSCHRHTNGACEGWLVGDQRIPPTWCNGCRVSACTAQ